MVGIAAVGIAIQRGSRMVSQLLQTSLRHRESIHNRRSLRADRYAGLVVG